MVSGDGDYVRHAIVNEDNAQIGRVWVNAGDGMGHWAAGFVQQSYPHSSNFGLFLSGRRILNYQVLTAGIQCLDASNLDLAANGYQIDQYSLHVMN